MGARTISL